MRRSASIAILVAILVGALAARAEAANSRSFADSRGEECCVGDISRVTVSNDDVGIVRLAIRIPVRPFTFDYSVWRGGPNSDPPVVSRWNGPGWKELRARLVRAADDGRVATFTFDRSALGHTDGFDFAVATLNAGTMHSFMDRAPDGGFWSYGVRIARRAVQPALAYRPAAPRAGGLLTAALCSGSVARRSSLRVERSAARRARTGRGWWSFGRPS